MTLHSTFSSSLLFSLSKAEARQCSNIAINHQQCQHQCRQSPQYQQDRPQHQHRHDSHLPTQLHPVVFRKMCDLEVELWDVHPDDDKVVGDDDDDDKSGIAGK